jgi:hypothetical protein
MSNQLAGTATIWQEPNKHTILVVQQRDLLPVLSSKGNLVVCLVPARDGGQLGAGELGQRVQVQAIDCQCSQIESEQHRSEGHFAWELEGTQLLG